ncbi:acetylornithine deacetylase [Acuticoccus sp. M5D2P5]|uniref:acetylornithine deacetylase n=1 Tax=Acuticoccus kalidii TaxID=2910977 RepID=UPI001F35806B|nr:acetylornithine deacetylase [Acuticoccus kalidii]MCF3932202.1 acetylornithine deacetylase [Acuticoccus kalidii]
MDERLEETVAILADLVAFPTVSSESNLALIDYVVGRLGQLGARLDVTHDADGRKANLFATLGPMRAGGIVLSGHTDVVPAEAAEWTGDPFTLREEDGRLYGRGTCDMKGFIAATLALAPHFAALPLTRPVHFAFTYDEEVGCVGARQLCELIEQRDARPAIAIIGEPTEMRVIEGHKGCCEYTTHFHGLAGHGSNPAAGVNAIDMAVRYIARLLDIGEELKTRAPEASRFEPPYTTVQVGEIEGGTARNVIAAHCRVGWEMRPVQYADQVFVKEHLARYCGEVLLPRMREVHPEARIETEVIGEVAGLEPASVNAARDIALALTGRRETDVVAFGTEAGLFQAIGLSAAVCGPGSIEQAHRIDEFVTRDQLSQALVMLRGLGPTLTA